MLATFFTITTDDITASINYSASLVGDFLPLLLLIIGLSVGMYIIYSVVRIFF